MGVAITAYETENFIRDIYIKGDIRITDKSVYESYKKVYQVHFRNEDIEKVKLDELTKRLLLHYDNCSDIWEHNIGKNMIGQVFLRLMISVKKMSGSIYGEFGYLNYLKNNLKNTGLKDQFIMEDKFGNKRTEDL